MTKLENIEKDYWWEIRSYLVSPTYEGLVEFLGQVYEDGYKQAEYDYGGE